VTRESPAPTTQSGDEQEKEGFPEEKQLDSSVRPGAPRWKFPEPTLVSPEPSNSTKTSRSLPKYQDTATPEPLGYTRPSMAKSAATGGGPGELERSLVIGIDFGTTFTGLQPLSQCLSSSH
jgi:hypothetical protein